MRPMKINEYFALLSCYVLRNKIDVTHLPESGTLKTSFQFTASCVDLSPNIRVLKTNNMDDNRNVKIQEY